MRKILSLTVAAALAGFVAAPALVHSEETVIEKHSTYNSEHTEESVPAPAVRERTTVETMPAPPMEQKRTTETVVKKGHDSDHDSKTKVESKTKIEHDDD